MVGSSPSLLATYYLLSTGLSFVFREGRHKMFDMSGRWGGLLRVLHIS